MFGCNLHRRIHIAAALIVAIGLARIACCEEAVKTAQAEAPATVAVIQAEIAPADVVVEAKRATEKAKVPAEKPAKEGDEKEGDEKEGDEKKDAEKEGDEKKPKAAKKKKAGGAAIKALFNAFVPAAPAFQAVAPAQATKQISLKKLGGVTEENVKKLEEAVNKNRSAKAHLKQFEPRFKQLVDAELRLVHEVCGLKRSQFDAIKDSAKLVSRACALEAAQYQAGMENGWQGRRPDHPNPFVLIEDTLIKAVQKTLPPKQSSQYEQEIEARRAFEKVADAEKIVSCLDKDLGLSQEQRVAMVQPIADAWQYKWKSNLQLIEHNGNQYLPNIPKTEIKKLLTAEQRDTFNSMSRHSNVFFGMQLNDLPQVNRKLKKLEDEVEFAPEDESS